MKLAASVQSGLGLLVRTVDIRIEARANFIRGEIVQLDTHLAQSFNLTFGDSRSGWYRAIKPNDDGARYGCHVVTLEAISFGQRGKARLCGIVPLYTGSTQDVGSVVIPGGAALDGYRIKGRILNTGVNGYNDVLWHGVIGFGEYVAEVTGNDPPEADIVATPSTGYAPLSVLLDAGASTDPDGSITNYKFNDGEGGGYINNGILDHKTVIYETPGTYYPSVLVTDNDDAQDVATTMITVLDPGGGGDHEPPNQGSGTGVAGGTVIAER